MPQQNLTDGRKVVTTAGTAVQLATTATRVGKVTVTAETDNTGLIVIGGSTVVAALATRRGTPLGAGDTAEIDVDQLTDIYFDAEVNGEGVTFTVEGP